MARRPQRIQSLNPRRRQSPFARLLTVIAVVIVLLIAALWFLSTLAREQPLERIEQPVANAALAG